MQSVFALSVPYDTGARQLVRAFQDRIGEVVKTPFWSDTTFLDQVLVTWLELSPADALLPRVLRDDTVWRQGMRDQVVRDVRDILAGRKGTAEISYAQSRQMVTFSTVLRHVHELADEEAVPFVSEWLFARALAWHARDALQAIGVSPEALVDQLGEGLGIRPLSPVDRSKLWCFCDTNILIEGKYFNEADWRSVLSHAHPVLVVSAPVLRELDRLKSDPSIRHRNKRARQVLPELLRMARRTEPGVPAALPSGVEILVEAREPLAFPHRLDPSQMDDRVIAAALEFRWRRAGAEVVLLTADGAPFVRARELGLTCRMPPENMIQKRLPPETIVYSIEDVASVLGLSADRIQKLVEQGEIPHTRNNGDVLFDRQAIAEWSHGRSMASLRRPSSERSPS